MPDVVDKKTRSRMMAGIRGKDTKPELLIRKELHKRGFRYKLHDRKLPGKPDMVLPKYQAVVLGNGCFWHGHNCHLFRWPSSRVEFWYDKITQTKEKDKENIDALMDKGWRVLEVWECSLKGKAKLPIKTVINQVAEWLRSEHRTGEIRGVIG